MKTALHAAIILALIPMSAWSAPRATETKDATAQQGKPLVRKAPETRERKRGSSASVGRGCVGCIVPLDGIAATMAVRRI